jgi:hypothetical protein
VTSTYLNLDLTLTGSRKAGFFAQARTELLQSPSERFEFPYEALALESLICGYSEVAAGTISDADRTALMDPKEFGSKLFEAVFDGEVRDVLRKSEGTEGVDGIRVRVRVESPELTNVPWEFLHDNARSGFLATTNKTPLVRTLNLSSSAQTPQVTDKIRVLVMTSNPSTTATGGTAGVGPRGESGLDTKAEVAGLEAEFAEHDNVEIVRVDPSVSALQDALTGDGDFHIFHFIGHGRFESDLEQGHLVLETTAGAPDPVKADELAAHLGDHGTLRLIVLNACEGARSSTDPTSGMAQRLFANGIEAVVAMQFEISDSAALTFSREFYSSIAANDPVEEATTEARKAVLGLENEWATPVLFLRSPNGELFTDRQPPSGASRPAWLSQRALFVAAGVLAVAILLGLVLSNRGPGTSSADTTPAQSALQVSRTGVQIPPSDRIVDANLDIWTIDSDGSDQILKNGLPTGGQGATVVWVGETVFAQSPGQDAQWWRWTDPGWENIGQGRSATIDGVEWTIDETGGISKDGFFTDGYGSVILNIGNTIYSGWPENPEGWSRWDGSDWVFEE